MEIKMYPGSPYPLGASWNGKGVNFAIFSENATKVELCFFNEQNNEVRVILPERLHHVWHGYVPGIQPGQAYGYRVYGTFNPAGGLWFNDNKLLIDPYAKALTGNFKWHESLFDFTDEKISFKTIDTAPYVPKAVVIDDSFDWENDMPPRIAYHHTIIYEAHVKGLTQLHPEIPEEIRGSYAAIAHPVIIKHLKQLGVTAIELLPVHYFLDEQHLIEKGLSEYWGYNTIGFFAPDNRYVKDETPGAGVIQFKQMVKALHKAGIEVILDVVYNHTAEGNHMGPTVSLKGIDNSSYYRLQEDDKLYYVDYSGTGNTLNALQPNVLKLIMDSLRYWVTDMHVDGFRFDLATAITRGKYEVDKLNSFFDIIYQDPVLSTVKLIAEPWDVGKGGYQLGKFPPGWAEWNGKYRDCMRDYWRGEKSMLAEFAERFTGSSDLYKNDYRNPTASINFITAHDGFTLHDLVTYSRKHNEANLDNNADGDDENRSSNYGVEGETADAAVNMIRAKQKRNMLATLILSQGVAMLKSGDELGTTQKGNNNTYCQDNELSWIDWNNADDKLLAFTGNLIKFAKAHPAFCRRLWFKGKPVNGAAVNDISWFLPGGEIMHDKNWQKDAAKSVAIYLNGNQLQCIDEANKEQDDKSFYIIFNAHDAMLAFTLPSNKYAAKWITVIDTTEYDVVENGKVLLPGNVLQVAPLSMVVLMSI